jgi:hypothetical protein
MSSASPFNEFGYKRLTLENWLTVDPAWSGVVMSCSRSDPSEAWVHDLIQTELDPAVPLPIRKLFEIARGTLVYSLMFYPLLTLGTEQMFRVFDASVSAKCKEMKAPSKVQRFADKIKWLGERAVISPEQQSRFPSGTPKYPATWRGIERSRYSSRIDKPAIRCASPDESITEMPSFQRGTARAV